MKSFRLNWPVFLVSFGIGILYIYIANPPPKIILKFPSPYNAGKVIYRDKADDCFVFDAERLECPKDGKQVKKQPVQL